MSALIKVLAALAVGTALSDPAGPDSQIIPTAQSHPLASSEPAAGQNEASKPPVTANIAQFVDVRIIDAQGIGIAGAVVRVVGIGESAADDGPGFNVRTDRTTADGSFRLFPERNLSGFALLVRSADGAVGWAYWSSSPSQRPVNAGENKITVRLLRRNREVEGTIVDAWGEPIEGVRIRARQFNEDANGLTWDYWGTEDEPSLGSAVTDKFGKYRFSSLPENATLTFTAHHPAFVGPTFGCKSNDRTVPPVTLEDAGGIAGTLVDMATGEPVAGAAIAALRIEHTDLIPEGLGAGTISDDKGHFLLRGLEPGVYNVVLQRSRRGRQFTARAVEGVRVAAGEMARTDLKMLPGRRLRGRAIDAATGKPLVGAAILCRSASHPSSGQACQTTHTDEEGRFEHFVPAGLASVSINVTVYSVGHQRTLTVPDDRDAEPVVLKQGEDGQSQPLARARAPVECAVRLRAKWGGGDRNVTADGHSLTGWVRSKEGSPLAGVHVYFMKNNRITIYEGATDRDGAFRLSGLPEGPRQVGLFRGQEDSAWASIPVGARAVEIIFPE